jgi:hypothetical protein
MSLVIKQSLDIDTSAQRYFKRYGWEATSGDSDLGDMFSVHFNEGFRR